MNRLVASGIMLLLACAGTVQAAPPMTPTPTAPTAHASAPDAAALAGTYHLEGVMETGSDLLVRADGTFEWGFTYGALDLLAKGHWQAEGDGITLRVEDMAFPPRLPEMKFERMHLRREGSDLVPSWPWDMDAFREGAERGAYVRE
jgi:hypothetical protein